MRKNSFFISLCVLLLTLFASSCASRHDYTAPSASVEEGDSAHQFPPDTSSQELNRIKSMAGRWESTTSMFGKENEKVYTEYSVSAGGSAVVETIFPGTPYEMVSVYYDDENGKLAMTHYCMMRNRPYFRLAKSTSDSIKLDVVKIEG
ncbi:MAG: hypothetical protein KDD42_07715, partial [Bdellovibrionales bacterium]|nr:hypothetical protein [Bdellovibrionales bacterium]